MRGDVRADQGAPCGTQGQPVCEGEAMNGARCMCYTRVYTVVFEVMLFPYPLSAKVLQPLPSAAMVLSWVLLRVCVFDELYRMGLHEGPCAAAFRACE